MGNETPWIKERIIDVYPNLDRDGGVDMDSDGDIEGTEVADTDGDHFVNNDEAQAFYRNNRVSLNNMISFFRWGNAFGLDNPIHNLLHLESALSTPSDVQAAYEFLTTILTETRESLSQIPESAGWSPVQKMRHVYSILRAHGAHFEDHLTDDLLTSNIKQKTFDYDTTTFVLLAVAHEMGWPIYVINTPRYVFPRWDDGDNGVRLNFDMLRDEPFTDENYIRQEQLDASSIERGVYLSNLSPSELLGSFYYIIGKARIRQGHYEEAIAAYNKATELNPRDAESFNDLGGAQYSLGRYQEAIAAYNKATELNPRHPGAFHNRGLAEIRLERYAEAVADFDWIINELNLGDAVAFNKRGEAKMGLGRYQEAIDDFNQALRLNPHYAQAGINLANAILFKNLAPNPDLANNPPNH